MRLGHLRLRQALLLTVLVPALLGFSTLLVRSAAAQDGEGGDDAAEADEPQGPEIEPSIRFVDRRSMVQIQLPKNWRAEKFTDNNGELAHWVWPVEGDRVVAQVTLSRRTDYMRAPLMRYMNLTQRTLVPGTEREGDGWVEACGIEKDRIAVWERYVEKDGIVWVAQFICHKDNIDMFKPVFVAALDTFEITGKYEPKGLPDGWTRKKLKDFVLETDADGKNVDEAAGLVESLYDMKKLAKKVLDGSPFWPGPTVVKVIQNGALFDKIATAATGQKPDNAGYDPRGRALLVKWMSRRTQGFDSGFKQFAAAQLVSEHYGGNLPFWLSGGLRMYLAYGTEDSGKPQKPDKARMSRTKGTVSRAKRRLDQWFTTKLSDVPDTDEGFAEVWAWHWFFRHAKQGKKYRKTYEACLDTLLATGDPGKAFAVWEATDFEAVQAAFKKWGASLK